MKALHIGAANVRRLIRERSNIFFVFVFPLATVLLIGAQFGGSGDQPVGLVDGDGGGLSASIAAALDDASGIEVRSYTGEDELLLAVERSQLTAGVLIPPGFEAALRGGRPAEVGYIARTVGTGPQLQAQVDQIVAAATAPIDAARFAAPFRDEAFVETLAMAESLNVGGGVDVKTTRVGEALFPESLGRFDLGASSQLLLFMFVTGLAGSAVMIQSRQLGITSRMLATPTSIGQIVGGEAAGRFGVVLLQGVYIMAATLLMFGVNWGDPLGAAAVLIAFAAVGAGAAMLMGTLFRNDQQAAGVGIVAALGLGALGGCMLPIELFPPTLAKVARVTPHAWANDAFAELVRRDGNVVDILPQLGVLAAFAVVLLGAASWRLRQVITRP